jgi:hypothetical protein
MNETFDSQEMRPDGSALPETPHELPFDRGVIDALSGADPVDANAREELRDYYRQKWEDVGPLYLAELLSTEFMTEQRARGDVLFSERLLQLGQTEANLWHEIRQFFRRKEMVTALLAAAHDPSPRRNTVSDEDDEEDLWE